MQTSVLNAVAHHAARDLTQHTQRGDTAVMVAAKKKTRATRIPTDDYARMRKLMADTLDSMRTLSPPRRSAAYRLIADNYPELRRLREAGWSWGQLGEKVNKAGIGFRFETLRRAMEEYEKDRGIAHAGRRHITVAEGRKTPTKARKRRAS